MTKDSVVRTYQLSAYPAQLAALFDPKKPIPQTMSEVLAHNGERSYLVRCLTALDNPDAFAEFILAERKFYNAHRGNNTGLSAEEASELTRLANSLKLLKSHFFSDIDSLMEGVVRHPPFLESEYIDANSAGYALETEKQLYNRFFEKIADKQLYWIVAFLEVRSSKWGEAPEKFEQYIPEGHQRVYKDYLANREAVMKKYGQYITFWLEYCQL